jgi:hypothetical protein
MNQYRLYRLNAAGHFKSGDVIEAASDTNAVSTALRQLGSERGELWLGSRKLALSI